MRLPPFLRFLEPKLRRLSSPSDRLGFRGDLLVERQEKDGPVEVVYDDKNFIVDVGITAIRDVLIGTNGGGFVGSIFRMAIGDGGTTSATELFNPRPTDDTWPARTGLYHEVFRQDISVFETPTPQSMRFVSSFVSGDVLNASYSLADKVINEAALIIGDGITTVGGDKKQAADPKDADEIMLSTRTFNSASFNNTEDVTITVTWTLTVASA